MKTLLLRAVLVAALCPLLAGCFTYFSYKNAEHSEYLKPIALYKGIDGGLAVEGCWQPKHNTTNVPKHVFLLIPRRVVEQTHLNRSTEISFNDIASLPHPRLNELQIKRNLPTGYDKAADWSQKGGFAARTHNLTLGFIGKLPVTLLLDAATAPLQALFVIALTNNGPIVDG